MNPIILRRILLSILLLGAVGVGGMLLWANVKLANPGPGIRPVSSATSTFYTECDSPLEKDRNIPVSKKYEFGGVLGTLFTAIECSDVRSEDVYQAYQFDPLETDLSVFLYYNDRPEVFDVFQRFGFTCDFDLNSEGVRVYDGPCILARGKNLTLEQLKSLHALNPKLSYSFINLPFDTKYKSSFVFEHQISPLDPICKIKPVNTEIGGAEYAVSSSYAKIPNMGEVFTQYQCENPAFRKSEFEFGLGSELKLKAPPSSGLKTALQRAGFVCRDQLKDYNTCTEWLLIPFVPIEYLFPIDNYLDEIEGESCFHCG